MRFKDYEAAIDVLNAGVSIDEVVLLRGPEVKTVYGHCTHVYVKWDAFGRGFTAMRDEDEELKDPCTVKDWQRSPDYDLLFQ